MASKVEEIINNHCIGKDVFIAAQNTRLYSCESILLAMKEIASIAFDAGQKYGENIFSSAIPHPPKKQFIDYLFNNE